MSGPFQRERESVGAAASQGENRTSQIPERGEMLGEGKRRSWEEASGGRNQGLPLGKRELPLQQILPPLPEGHLFPPSQVMQR